MIIKGTKGNDILSGGQGNGNDTLQGGLGDDTYQLFDAGDVVVELLNSGIDLVNSSLMAYTLPSNVENGRIKLTAAANLNGNELNNILIAGDGDNVLDGLAGNDTVSYAQAKSGVTLNLSLSSAQATGGSGSDTLLNIENLKGSIFNDKLTGNSLDNILDGGFGNDLLLGGAGNDTLLGGAGNDVLKGGTGNDVLQGGGGNDTLMGGTGSDTLTGGSGIDRFDFTELGANNGASAYGTIKTITDFVSGTDKLVFAANKFDNGTLAGKYVENLMAAASLDALKLDAAAAHDAGAQYYFGIFNGNGYLFADDVGDGWGNVIKLEGTTDIAATDITISGSQAGKAVIDLGVDGKLTAPVQVEGKWYYHWDRSGDGTSADTGTLNGGVDYSTHAELNGIFNQDVHGNLNPGTSTTNEYRYATLNGVKLALATANGSLPFPNSIPLNESSVYQTGTSVQNGKTNNLVFDDLLAIWDAYNGAGADTSNANGLSNVNGTPSGWLDAGYWSATPMPNNGHASIIFLTGQLWDLPDFFNAYTALQVI